MSVFIFLLVLFVIVIIPVMIGARAVGATNTGVGAAALSVLLLTAISWICDRTIGNHVVNFLVTAGIGGLAMAGLLGTTFWRAIGVAAIASAIQLGIALLFFGAALTTAH